MAAIIALRGVSKHYLRGSEDLAVLSDFNLDIEERDFVAIMGPAGSGKTTLLNLSGGLETPSSGQISVAGKRLDALSGAELARWRARHVGFIFQFYNLMPALTAVVEAAVASVYEHHRDMLAMELEPCNVATTGDRGVAVEHVEALAFAWLAREALAGRPGNLPAVTGARGLRVLGAIDPL